MLNAGRWSAPRANQGYFLSMGFLFSPELQEHPPQTISSNGASPGAPLSSETETLEGHKKAPGLD